MFLTFALAAVVVGGLAVVVLTDRCYVLAFDRGAM